MTDETNAQLTAEGHHMMVPAHLDDSQLATMTEGELRNMALEMGLSVKSDATKDDLIQLLCAETVYI